MEVPTHRKLSPAQSLMGTITCCFDNDTYSDLVVKYRDKSWKLHRVIVCSQSKVLHAACTGSFKEAYTGVIDLEDDDPVSVEIMLKYFYTGKYTIPETNEKQQSPQLRLHILTHALADKYDIPRLMIFAEQEFTSTLNKGLKTKEYVAVVSDVYTILTSTNSLRRIAIEYGRPKFRSMMLSPDVEALRATLEELPEFAFDLVRLFVMAPPKDPAVSMLSSYAVRSKLRPSR